jgi:SOS-response transcriptional repressor LexA
MTMGLAALRDVNRTRKREPGPLTPRQREVYDLVFSIICREGRRPGVRDVMAHFGMASTNAAMCHLRALHAKGYIRLGGVMKRGGDFTILRRPDGRPFKGLTPID